MPCKKDRVKNPPCCAENKNPDDNALERWLAQISNDDAPGSLGIMKFRAKPSPLEFAF